MVDILSEVQSESTPVVELHAPQPAECVARPTLDAVSALHPCHGARARRLHAHGAIAPAAQQCHASRRRYEMRLVIYSCSKFRKANGAPGTLLSITLTPP